MDENSLINEYDLDHKNNKLKFKKTLMSNNESKDDVKIPAFDNYVFTGESLMHKNWYYPFNDTTDPTKNYEFLTWQIHL
jgi:hypothetical protein